MIRTLASEINHAKKMDQIHAKNIMPLKKRMLGLHGIMASSHQLIHKHHTKTSDPQTSMQLKKLVVSVYGQI
jgi:hypothetical protein